MLEFIRRSKENIFFRLFIVLLVATFVVWIVSDVISKNINPDIAEFKYAPNINLVELKQETQKSSKIFKSIYPNIEEREIYPIVLNQMINQRLIDAFAEEIGIEYSEATIIKYLKASPQFKDKENKFEDYNFRKLISRQGLLEEDSLKALNTELNQKLVPEVFMKTNSPPTKLKTLIKNYISEFRMVDLITIPANGQNVLFMKAPEYQEKDYKEFYEKHKEAYLIKEKRDIEFLVINKDLINKQKKIQDEQEVKNSLAEYNKLLEEEVSAGATFEEICAKVNVTPKTATVEAGQTYHPDLGNVIMNTDFENLQEGEISYPFLVKNYERNHHAHNPNDPNNNIEETNEELAPIAIIKVKKVYPQHIPSFDDVKKEVAQDYKADLNHTANKDRLNKLRERIVASKNFDEAPIASELNGIKYTIERNRKVIRQDNQLPPEVVDLIFKGDKNSVTPTVYYNNDKGYLAIIKDIKFDPKQKIDDSNFDAQIQNSYFEELLYYLRQHNNTKIHYNLITSE